MEEFQQGIKVPKDRVAVIIGEKGKTKRELEDALGVKIHIDSDEGEVTLSGKDSIKIYTANEVIKAIARGFNPEIATLLLKTDYQLEIVNVTDYAEGQKAIQRLRGRVIGEGGKARRTIEELTDAYLSVYGKTICIIGEADPVSAAKRGVDALLSGAPHSTVYRLLEKLRRDRKRKDINEFNRPRMRGEEEKEEE
jgi:ribosomal RNA assembly protein